MAEETETQEQAPSAATAVAETEHVAETQAQPATQADNTRERVTALEETVSSLVARVAELTPDPRDRSPEAVPWTHRNRFGKS